MIFKKKKAESETKRTSDTQLPVLPLLIPNIKANDVATLDKITAVSPFKHAPFICLCLPNADEDEGYLSLMDEKECRDLGPKCMRSHYLMLSNPWTSPTELANVQIERPPRTESYYRSKGDDNNSPTETVSRLTFLFLNDTSRDMLTNSSPPF